MPILYVAYPSDADPHHITFTSFDENLVGKTDARLTPMKTIGRPGLAASVRSRLFAYCRGADAKAGEFNLLVTSTLTRPTIWEPLMVVPEIGIWSSPSLALMKDDLYCAFRGPGGGGTGHLHTLLSSLPANQTTYQWTEETIYEIHMVESPALAVYFGKLYCAYQRHSPKGQLDYAIYDFTTKRWTVNQPIKDAKLAESPAILSVLGKLYVFYHDAVAAKHLSYSVFDNNIWTAPKILTDVRIAGSPTLVSYQGKLLCFYREANSGILSYISLNNLGTTTMGVELKEADGKPIRISGSPSAISF